jgi:hypothetical protein
VCNGHAPLRQRSFSLRTRLATACWSPATCTCAELGGPAGETVAVRTGPRPPGKSRVHSARLRPLRCCTRGPAWGALAHTSTERLPACSRKCHVWGSFPSFLLFAHRGTLQICPRAGARASLLELLSQVCYPSSLLHLTAECYWRQHSQVRVCRASPSAPSTWRAQWSCPASPAAPLAAPIARCSR